jgi:hypothetical protein
MLLPHDLTTKTVCLAVSIGMAVCMYIPLYRRFGRRHHTRDFSKAYCWLNFAVQVNNGVLAASEHAPFLVFWYALQSVATGVTLWLVYKYWDSPSPG